jgi:hypothetical protein
VTPMPPTPKESRGTYRRDRGSTSERTSAGMASPVSAQPASTGPWNPLHRRAAASDDMTVMKRERLTRAEIRERSAADRARRPEARVYGVEVSDASAECWVSQIVFFAGSRDEAEERLASARFRRGGVSTCSDLDPDEITQEARTLALNSPQQYFRSRLNGRGWTCWEALLPSYKHPTDARGARDASVWGPGGEAWRKGD